MGKYLRPLFVKKVKGEIRVCILSVMETSYANKHQSSLYLLGPRNNLINEEYLLSLTKLDENKTDTIVYKESYVVFK